MKRALAVLLCSLPAYAEPPFLPIAVCDETQCVRSKVDFEKFQQFHMAVFKRMESAMEEMQRQEGTIGELMNRLNRTPHCQMRMS